MKKENKTNKSSKVCKTIWLDRKHLEFLESDPDVKWSSRLKQIIDDAIAVNKDDSASLVVSRSAPVSHDVPKRVWTQG